MLATKAPTPKKKAKAMNELMDSCIMPLNPWPLGQPSAMRAPIIATIPPKNEKMARLAIDDPKRFSHVGGTASNLKSFIHQ